MSDVLRKELNDEDKEFLIGLTAPRLERMFWGSPMRNGEAEMIVRQTVGACGLNLREHGDAFSWLGTGTRACHGNGLVNNPKGMRLAFDAGFIVQEDAPEGLVPPVNTVLEDGKPQVLRVTKKLMEYARAEALAKA